MTPPSKIEQKGKDWLEFLFFSLYHMWSYNVSGNLSVSLLFILLTTSFFLKAWFFKPSKLNQLIYTNIFKIMKSTCVRSCIINSVSFELHQFLRLRFLFSVTAHCKCVLANLNKKGLLNCWIPFQNCVTHIPWFKLAFSCAEEINPVFSQKYLQCKTLHSFPFLPKGRKKKSHKHNSLYFPEIQCIFWAVALWKIEKNQISSGRENTWYCGTDQTAHCTVWEKKSSTPSWKKRTFMYKSTVCRRRATIIMQLERWTHNLANSSWDAKYQNLPFDFII